MKLLTREAVETLLMRTQFREWRWRLIDCTTANSAGWLLQAEFDAPCTKTGAMVTHRGRQFYVSQYATADEVVKSCWVAIELAQRHEAMEEFLFDRRAPFHPHTSVIHLRDLQDTYPHVMRNPEAQQ